MNLVDCTIKKENGADYLDFDNGLQIPVPPRSDVTLEDGKKVTMGIRTEEISIADDTTSGPSEWIFDGLVKVVEQLGNENHLHIFDAETEKVIYQEK